MKKILTYNRASLIIFSIALISSLTLFTAAQNAPENVFEDFDGDGLSNREEQTLGTDYQNADTDGDGYGDGVEVASGYDPLKPAPGDRLIEPKAEKEELGRGGDNTNLTEAITEDVYSYLKDVEEAGRGGLSTEEFNENVGGIVEENVSFNDLPAVDTDRIRIKDQDYDDLSDEQEQKRIDDDNIEYITQVLFLLRKHTPELFEGQSSEQTVSRVVTETNTFFSTLDDATFFETILGDAEILTERLYDLTVPEEMFDVHIEAIQLFEFALSIKEEGSYLDVADDPFAFIITLTKIQTLIVLFQDYSDSLQVYIDKYDLQEIDSTISR